MSSARSRQWVGWSLPPLVQMGVYAVSITAFVLAFLAVWEVGPFRPVFSLACWTVILMLIQNVTKRDHDTAMDELRRRLPPTQVGSGTA